MSKTTSIIIAALILAFFYFTFSAPNAGPAKNVNNGTTKSVATDRLVENSVVKDGVQYVTITARGGYSPRASTATSGIPTKLVIKTNGTYDCSAALVIRSLNYRSMLPNTAETIIDAGTPKAGDVILGVCAMGMYNFTVAFK
jgi:plastocyanin domain-containing protein